MADSLGIAVGHLYYFLEDIAPLMTPSRKRLLKTPKVIELLFSGGNPIPAADHPQVLFENELMIQQAIAAQQAAEAEAAAANGQQQQQQQDRAQAPAQQPHEGVILAQ